MAPVTSLMHKPSHLRGALAPAWLLQAGFLILCVLAWEIAGASGLFFRGVLPSIPLIAMAFFRLLSGADFWSHLAVTSYEVGVAFVIGAGLGTLVGLVLGIDRWLGAVAEPIVYYLAPAPKIIFLPILLVLFGVGPGSKIAIGAVSCFFPVALSVAAGVRLVSPVLIRVGRSLRLSPRKMVLKIYLPALMPAFSSGLRLGLGVAIVGCLLSEIKLSNKGLGFMAMGFYQRFDIAPMLSVLLTIFLISALLNRVLEQVFQQHRPQKS